MRVKVGKTPLHKVLAMEPAWTPAPCSPFFAAKWPLVTRVLGRSSDLSHVGLNRSRAE